MSIFKPIFDLFKEFSPLFEIFGGALRLLMKPLEIIAGLAKKIAKIFGSGESREDFVKLYGEATIQAAEQMAKKLGISNQEALKKILEKREKDLANQTKSTAQKDLQSNVINNQMRQSKVNMSVTQNISGISTAGTAQAMKQAAKSAFTLELQKLIVNTGF